MYTRLLMFKTIDEYISTFPQHVQEKLQVLRETIRKAAPTATEAISYQMPTYKLNGNLVHFAGYEKHIGLYPAPSGITAFESELAPYRHAKGSVQFPLHEPLPLELITKIVTFRVKQNNAKQK